MAAMRYKRSQMSGDNLHGLVRPLISESHPTTVGRNKAVKSKLSQSVDCWFNQQNAALTRIERLQQNVYVAMVRLAGERKKIERRIRLEGIEQKEKVENWLKAHPFNGSNKNSPIKNDSIAQENMRRRRLLEIRRKEQLDNELLPLYRKDSTGRLISEGVFQRKQWEEPPSKRREEYKRKKLLEKETGIIDNLDLKKETLYENISKYETAKPYVRKATPPPVEEEKNFRRASNVGLTLSTMMKVFNSEKWPEGVDPNSVQGLTLCRYIRLYGKQMPREVSEVFKRALTTMNREESIE
ncbi:DgyrCDS8455 [Dimorphilus gyrociliatus]|uniref:DgyrCDS8455 n=1 Tax=Dimorphilus gyrociliatus TaxID=2664684 RepID=A0A7I8VUF2_9ANNE|nr:DgyrCDS8455 [Dimorphilus gyrociliatus]